MTATTIDRDVYCVSCGYNLRGLQEDGRCPECGTDIDRSFRKDLIEFSDPAWVTQMSRGATIVNYAYILTLLGSLLGACIVMPIIETMISSGVELWILGAWSCVTTAFLCYGVVLLTSADPRRSRSAGMHRLGTGCRVGAGLVPVLLAMLWGWRFWPAWTRTGLVSALVLILTLWVFALLGYICGLADRLAEQPQLSRRRTGRLSRKPSTIQQTCRKGRIVLVVSFLLVAVVSVLAAIPWRIVGGVPVRVIGTACFITTIALASVMWDLFGACHKAFQEARMQAELNWLAGTHHPQAETLPRREESQATLGQDK